MGAYKYIQETMQKQFDEHDQAYKQRLIDMRREPAVNRLEHPTNLPRARTLGFKAKQGFIVARVRVTRGSGFHRRPVRGRKPRNMGVNRLTRAKSKQWIAEERAARRFPNLEVLNSYWIAEDGKNKWFEVILVDPQHPAIKNDSTVSWVATNRGRVFRGRTSAGHKGRGMTFKGYGTEKNRPSIRSHKKLGK